MSTPTPASDIGLDFVPRPLDSVTSREMGGETVLLDRASGAVYRLDAVGTVVWSTFDGSAELGVLVEGAGRRLRRRRRVVGRDVLDLTRTLAHIGLLADIAPPVAPDTHDDKITTATATGRPRRPPPPRATSCRPSASPTSTAPSSTWPTSGAGPSCWSTGARAAGTA